MGNLRLKAWLGALGIYAVIIALFLIITFKTPIPPYEVPPIGLELAFGDPLAGGPDETPSSLAGQGDNAGGEESDPTSSSAPNIITDNTDNTDNLPDIKPPQVNKKEPEMDADTKAMLERAKNRQKGGTNTNGKPGGDNGTGSAPGPGGNSRGTGTGPNPGTQGFISGTSFIGVKPTCSARSVNADGEGIMKIYLTIDCSGNILEVNYDAIGGDYNGTDDVEIAKKLISKTNFPPVNDCNGPQKGYIKFKLSKSE